MTASREGRPGGGNLRSRGRRLARYVLLPLFGIAVGLGVFKAIEWYFWNGSIRGTRVVRALSRQVLGQDPSPEALAKGVALWRKSPDALFAVARRIGTESLDKQENDYGLSFVDPNGRLLSKLSGPLTLVLDPFTVYRNWPNQRTKRFTIDEHGFRATRRRPGKPTIVVLGGSTAFGFLLPADELALPSLLAQRITDFDVINASVVGYLSGQELGQMVHRLDRLRPAAYVVVNGWNDMFDQGFVIHREPGMFGFNNQFFEIQNRLHAFHTRIGGPDISIGGKVLPPLTPRDEEAYQQQVREVYVANLSKMHAFAVARGARFLAVFQPELGNKRFRTYEENQSLERWNTLHNFQDQKFTRRYAQMIRYAREYCGKTGIPFADLLEEPLITDDRQMLFYDSPHMNERGHVIMAEVLERRLRSLLAGAKVSAGTP